MSITPLTSAHLLQNMQLRFLGPADVAEVKQLCRDWFPVEYPDKWYEDITSNPKFYSLAATYDSKIIGFLIAEIKSLCKTNKEDADILAPYFPQNTQVAYILSLGVLKEFRSRGLASLMLNYFLKMLETEEYKNCKVVYLHVLTTNIVAIRFYEHRNFRQHAFLPYYYFIGDRSHDGFSYVLYINGGEAAWTLRDYVAHTVNALRNCRLCSLPQKLFRNVKDVFKYILSSKANFYHS